jgi:hypothetical protein
MSHSAEDEPDRALHDEDPRVASGLSDWDRDPLFAGLNAICEPAIQRTGADGVAVAVLTHTPQVRELAYASDRIAQQLDELQYTIGEGPSFDAYRDATPQSYPELPSGDQTSRWLTFATDATQLGIRAVFAFPILHRRRPMGVLEFYRRAGGGLDTGQHEAALVCATAIAYQLQANWYIYLARIGGTERAIETAAAAGLSHAADPLTRTHIHLAAGMVAIQLGRPGSEGVDRLRAYSYAHSRSISAVAADIIAHRLNLNDERDDTLH